MSGKLIAFEGIDNAGKTAVAGRVISELKSRKIDAVFAKERSTEIGPLLEDLRRFSPLVKTFLFAADRALLLDKYEKLLDDGTHVIFDRYFHSAIAYRVAEGMDEKYVRFVNKVFRRPDLAILFDIGVDLSVERQPTSKSQTPYAVDVLEKVREVYLSMIETDGLRRVDARQPVDAVFKNVLALVLQELNK